MDFKDLNNKNEFMVFKNECILDLSNSIDSLMTSDYKQSVNLTYWIRDYKNFIKQEKTFNPKYLPKYKFGSVVEVNLGFRVGSEFGGQHYGIVINKRDKKSNPNLTIIPMRSIKEKIHYTEVNIGNEFYNLAQNKVNLLNEQYTTMKNELEKEIDELEENLKSTKYNEYKNKDKFFQKDFDAKMKELILKSKELTNKIVDLESCLKRISKLKDGSLALPNQILTISKMRVKDPIRDRDTLFNITLSDTTMKIIKDKFEKLYF